jgi:alpha-2-macroglobulin
MVSSKLFRILRVIGFIFLLALGALIGRWSWRPPIWMRGLGRLLTWPIRAFWAGARALWRRSRLGFMGAAVGALILLGGVAAAGWWWHTRPDPVTVVVNVTDPGPTPLVKDARPLPLTLSFDASAARLEDLDRDVDDRVTLAPPLAGHWRWRDDRHLEFRPASDWPVGQSYKIQLDPALIPDHVRLDSMALVAQSALFEGRIDQLRFHQDSTQPRLKQVVATMRFSHPVDLTSLKEHLSLQLTGDPDDLPEGQRLDVDFELEADELGGTVYLRSAPLPIPPGDCTMVLTRSLGVRSTRGGVPCLEVGSAQVRVPGMYSYFRVSGVSLDFARDEDDEPEQVLIIRTTAGVHEDEIKEALRVIEVKQRVRADQVDEALLDTAPRVTLTHIPGERQVARRHAFRYRTKPERNLYVHVKAGTRSAGDYVLAKPYAMVRRTPPFPVEVAVLHDGALLRLSGERTLSIMARGLDAVRLRVGRVRPSEVAHLVSQTEGRFERPEFRGYHFDEDNISELFSEVRVLADAPPQAARYTSLDLSRYLSRDEGGLTRGLYFLSVDGWDPEDQRPTGESDRRFVMVTDMGLIVKRWRDGRADLFVQSLESGRPVARAAVQVLGKNGLPLVDVLTDARGHASLPRLDDFRGPREPVAYLVTRGGDVSFLPVDRYDRRLNLSSFDTGGVHETAERRLDAFLFSERGIYRPGDPIRLGLIAKASDWSPVGGVPLEVAIRDSRGVEVLSRRVRLPSSGLLALEHATRETSPTGTWHASLYIVRDDRRARAIGSTSVRVEEFLPDRMRVKARFTPTPSRGWVSPAELRAEVSLTNLFGTPAAERRVHASLTLSPHVHHFKRWAAFRFGDPLAARQRQTQDLGDARTDAKGLAIFDLGLDRFEAATWQLTFAAEGFEGGGGRSVHAAASVLVSPLEHLVGVRADGRLEGLQKGSSRTIDVVAVGPDLEPVAVDELVLALIERRRVSVLAQRSDGTYGYESRVREVPLSQQRRALPAEVLALPLDTSRPGDFTLRIEDQAGRQLSQIPYSVLGALNLAGLHEREARLEITLDRQDYAPGEAIELSVQAPYAGAGLITVERDRVLASRWFVSDGPGTHQTIRVPADMEGNGYVMVTWLRARGSEEIFTPALSYAVAPFSVSRARRTVTLGLEAPERVKPGEEIVIRYQADKPSRAIVFAVDEGILQVTGYRTPRPLAHFMKKRALQVETHQNLDLLMPEHSVWKALSRTGGGDDWEDMGEEALGRNLNPFRRRRHAPVVFWSGVVDADLVSRELRYRVPDHFNGELRVMAVAVADQALGAAEAATTVRGPFVLSPNVPTFMPPGDRFVASVTVANNVEGSGEQARVAVSLTLDERLLAMGAPRQELVIPEGREATVRFELAAADRLGSAPLTFTAQLDEQAVNHRVELSVRPLSPYLPRVVSGALDGGRAEIPLTRALYPEHRTLQVSLSTLPLGLARGLLRYLEDFPHGCTEQVVSRAFPALALTRHPELGLSPEVGQAHVARAIQILSARQNAAGAFGKWAANAFVSDFQTVYAAHFLTEARAQGVEVTERISGGALRYLQALVTKKERSLGGLRLQAHALYVLTRNGRVTTRTLGVVRKRLEERAPDLWRQDLAATYLAATYALLGHAEEASRLAEGPRLDQPVTADYAWFHDRLVRDAQLLTLWSRHFPERLRALDGAALQAFVAPVLAGRFNTVSSAFTIVALAAYADASEAAPPRTLRAMAVMADGARQELSLSTGLFPSADFPAGAQAIELTADADQPVFYQLIEAGFDTQPREAPEAHGVEVLRSLRDAQGEPVARVSLGDEVTVQVTLRAIGAEERTDLAVVDLLPGGFEVVRDARLRRGGLPGSTWRPESVDLREDRVVLLGRIGEGVARYVYKIKAISAGSFRVPPIQAASMYDREVHARAPGGTITVVGQ